MSKFKNSNKSRKPITAFLSCILICVMIFSILSPGLSGISAYATNDKIHVWDGSIADGFAGGNGTESNPYLIETPEQLAYLSTTVNNDKNYYQKFFMLISDIYLNEPAPANNPYPYFYKNEWTAIGTKKCPFEGKFNGNNYTIHGLYINKPNEDYQGLFGCSTALTGYSRTNIHNLKLKGVHIYGKDFVGSVIGYASYLSIYNIYTDGFVTGHDYIAGIAGKVNATNLVFCVNSCDVSGNSSITGISYGGSNSHTYNTGFISGNDYVYGIGGSALCAHSLGSVFGNNSNIHPIAPYHSSSFYLCQDTSIKENYALTSEKFSREFIFRGWDFENIWVMKYDNDLKMFYPHIRSLLAEGEFAPKSYKIATEYASGTGTEDDPYIITTAEELALFSYRSSQYGSVGEIANASHYMLGNDIILNDTSKPSWITSALEFNTIGRNFRTTWDFSGVFDGNNHKISGLFISSPENDFIGLFSELSTGAVIKNLIIEDSLIIGFSHLGSIVGRTSDGTIENCKTETTLIGCSYVGGITGLMHRGSISDCENSGKIYASGGVGGIIGCANNGDAIISVSKSANSGCITSTGVAGGIIGRSDTDKIPFITYISESFNSGEIITCSSARGITNCIKSAYNTVPVITNCYNSGSLHSSNTSIPIADKVATISSCYNVGQMFKNSECVSSPTEDMINQSYYDGYDFENMWKIDDSSGYPYPQLKNNTHILPDIYRFYDRSGTEHIPFSFSNTDESFSDTYRISDVYKTILQNKKDEESLAETILIFNKKLSFDKEWNGSCFGMSAIMALDMLGKIDPDVIQWNSLNLSDFILPKDSLSVESLINYYQLSQNLFDIIDAKLKSYTIMDDTIKKDRNVSQATINSLSKGVPVILGIKAIDTSNTLLPTKCMHAVLAYGMQVSGSTHKIYIWDPNHSDSTTTITIDMTKTSGSVVVLDNFFNELTKDFTAKEKANAELSLSYALPINNSAMNDLYDKILKKQDSLNSDKVSIQSEGSPNMLITNLADFVLINDVTGESVRITNGIPVHETDMVIGRVDVGYSSTDVYEAYKLSDECTSCTVLPQGTDSANNNTMLVGFIGTDGWYSCVESEKIADISFDSYTKKVTTNSDDDSYQSITSYSKNVSTSWDTVEVNGTSNAFEINISDADCNIKSDTSTICDIYVMDDFNLATANNVYVEKNTEISVSELSANYLTTQSEDLEAIKSRTIRVTDENDIDIYSPDSDENILKFTVIFNTNDNFLIDSYSEIENGSIIKEPEIDKTYLIGKKILYWYTKDKNGNEIPWNFESDKVTSNLQLFAKWEKESTNTITYNMNDETGNSVSVEKEFDSDYIFVECAAKREGYVFSGWNTSPYGNSLSFDNGDVYSENKDLKLYAVWLPTFFIFNNDSTYSFDSEQKFIYGINLGTTITSFITDAFENNNISADDTSGKVSTGTVIHVTDNTGTIYDTATVVIWGDVNGDGWYDGTDAVLVELLSKGMLTKEQVGAAAWTASDCNQDGIINNYDVELLAQAGLLLSRIDQNLNEEQLLTTNAYNDYLEIIPQRYEGFAEADSTTDFLVSFIQKFINLIYKVIDFFKKAVYTV